MSVKPNPVAVYDQPHQFEPLLPTSASEDLALKAGLVVEASLRLQGAVNADVRHELQRLVRAMNSYYSNRIEGQSTHPVNIDRALRKDFSERPDVARLQRIAVAHIDAEEQIEKRATDDTFALSSACLVQAHTSLYERLDVDDRMTEDGRAVEPGALRQSDVTVHRHHPPAWRAVPSFLARADQVYARPWSLERLLIATACAHHRLVWVHPFLDGNGRASRLQMHAALHRLTGGLWSVNRGLARRREEYYLRLAEADMPRHGDLDGRGNLSERMLKAWCEFFLDVCLDQVTFMTRCLDLDTLKQRVATLVRGRSDKGSAYRDEAILPLRHVLLAGPVSRAEFIRMTGLGERSGRTILSRLVKDGLLQSDTPKGEVRIGFPLDALATLFPNLYPEAASTTLD